MPRAHVVRHQRLDRLADELAPRVAEELFALRVGQLDDALLVGDHEAVRRQLEHVAEELLRDLQLLLRAPEALLLRLQLLGLVPRLQEQLLRAQVALEHLQAQRRARKQLLDERLLPRAERAEGGDLEHGEERVARSERPGHRLRRRGPAQTRSDAQVVRGRPASWTGLPSRAHWPTSPSPESRPLLGQTRRRQAVMGDAPQPRLAGFQSVEGRHPPTQRRHEAREQPFAELGEGRRPLQVARECRHVGLDPALVLHGRGPAPQDVDRPRQRPGLVHRVGERHGRAEIAAHDRLHRGLSARTGPTILRKVSRPRPPDRSMREGQSDPVVTPCALEAGDVAAPALAARSWLWAIHSRKRFTGARADPATAALASRRRSLRGGRRPTAP